MPAEEFLQVSLHLLSLHGQHRPWLELVATGEVTTTDQSEHGAMAIAGDVSGVDGPGGVGNSPEYLQ